MRRRTIRINELARELEVKSKEILDILQETGDDERRSHSSSLQPAEAETVRNRIRERKKNDPKPAVPELELPVPKRPRAAVSRTPSGVGRGTAASARPSIPVMPAGSQFRPPVKAFRPPILAKAPEASATAESAPATEKETAPAAPEAAASPPAAPSQAKPKPDAATRATDLQDPGLDKPEPPPVADMGPEVARPDVNLVPGRPNVAKVPLDSPAPPIPTPQVRRTEPAAAAEADKPEGDGEPRPVAGPAGPGAAAPESAVAQQAAAPARPGPPVMPPMRPGRPARPVTVPGAPQPRRPLTKSIRPPVPVRPLGPGGPRIRPGAPGKRAAAPSGARANVLVPGRPLVQRQVKASPMPGIPAPTPGQPTGYMQRPGHGPGMRPPMPGRPPGGPPGRPPGAGRGGPGQRRPRPPQQRRRDLEALAESKIQQRKRKAEVPKAANTEIFASDGTSVKELAEKLGIKASQIIKYLVEKGQFATINQPLELDGIKEISTYFGATATELTLEEEAVLDIDQEETLEDIESRPPVVTVMGHVDHGKTSLLDAIRTTNVAAREAGGITQAIGAYHVVQGGKRIVFIDTPGHEAFTKMRSHGAAVTDIVVLVVAADDGVMPQTIEAIDHAKAANVPIIVAVNKIDVPKAQPDKVRQQLSDRGLVPEDWGGDTIFCQVSAKTSEGIENLLEMINLVSDVRELKANPARAAIGVVLEAKLDRGMGPVATVLTQNGTLRVGDTFVVGSVLGKVRALMDDRGKKIKEAGPSSAVVVLGLGDLAEPGDQLSVIADTDRAKKIVGYREEKAREQAMAQTARLSLEQFQEQLAAGRAKELSIILKADFQGSATVLRDTLAKLTSDKVKVRVIHSGVGAIKESDILLAITSSAIVVGFNVRPERSASTLAEREGIDIRLHTVIYELVDELKLALAGLLEPIRKEEFLGRARVLEVFNITNVGTVAGCLLEEGMAVSNASARLLRDNVVVHTGKLDSLRRFKDNVKEVRAGQECGMHFERYNDVKKSDEIELFKTVEIAQDINELIPV